MSPKPKDVVLKSVKSEDPERSPVIPIIGTWAGKYCNLSVKEAVGDPEIQSDVLVKALEDFQYDGVFPYMDLSVEAEALGAELNTPEDDIPSVIKHPVSSLEDLRSLKKPEIEDTRIKIFIETVERLVEKTGSTHFVISYVIGPFTLAGQLLEVTHLLECAGLGKEIVDEAVRFSTSFIQDCIEAYSKTGCDGVCILEPTSSAELIPPEFFDKYSTPYVKELVNLIGDLGMSSILHVCGDTAETVESMSDTGADVLSLDSEVDLVEARDKVGEKVSLMGNVPPVGVIQEGDREDVRESCEDLIEDLGKERFILSSGCEIPKASPPENIRAMVEAAHSF